MTKEELPLAGCEDIRNIYNELVLAEVAEENPKNVPDGKWFRKESVSIYSPSQKEIHKGLLPEAKIIEAMEQALSFLNSDACDVLYRISVFHYLLEYIHPFYDGNGRLGRFISSYLLSQELEPVIAYRLSYTVKENINEYNNAFSICNDPLNKGDLTPFLLMFLGVIKTSVQKLKESLQEGFTHLNRCLQKIPDLVPSGDMMTMRLYDLLIQASLFSEIGVSTDIILNHLEISRNTLSRKLGNIDPNLLVKVRHGKTNFFSLDINHLDQM